MHSALRKLYSKQYVKPAKVGRYEHNFYFMRKNPNKPDQNETYKSIDKVALARLLSNESESLEELDLRERLENLAQMIREANHHENAI